MKCAREASDSQAVLDIVAAAPVLNGGLVACSKVWMTGGEGDTVGMCDQLWPTGETCFTRYQPLRVGKLVVRARQTDRA